MNFLSKANELELSGQYLDALNNLVEAKKSATGLQLELIEMNLKRIEFRLNYLGQLNSKYGNVVCVFEHDKNPLTYKDDVKGVKESEYLPLISFTSMSSRIERVSETIKSLNVQKNDFHSINLYISEEPKLLDKGISRHAEVLRELYEMGVNIYIVSNLGPYRKFYPIFTQLLSSKAPLNTPVITIDDDVIYPAGIFKKFMNVAKKYPESVIAHRGRKMILNKRGFGSYKSFVVPDNINDILNLGTGKNGILYRLKFFIGFEDLFVGPQIAPAADDLWCKWITATQGVSTVIFEPLAVFDSKLDFEESDPNDENSLYMQINKKGGNDVAIENLINYFSFLKNKKFN